VTRNISDPDFSLEPLSRLLVKLVALKTLDLKLPCPRKFKIHSKVQSNKTFYVLVKITRCWVPVAHACNPSYSAGTDQEAHSSKPAWGNSSQDPISKKKLLTKIGLVEWLKVKALSSSPRTAKKITRQPVSKINL
jgi:hypothetical protein